MYKVSDLNEESGFNKLLEHYERNKHKKWNEWLEVEELFPRPGKQGLLGIFRMKDSSDVRFVFKVSQYINYLVQHELTVMKALNDLGSFCPHFCRGIGGILADVDPNVRKNGNPFEINCKYPIEKEVLLTEYIPNSTKFYNYIRSSKISEQILYSTVKQTLLAISIAQKKKKFTHYDLHSNNIMMKKCNKDLVCLYILDEENQYCVPTYGKYPIIIDFGFAFADSLNGSPLWPSLGHTDIGFTSDRFDPFSDPKLFLVTVSGEIHEKRNNENSQKFLNIVQNLFAPLNIDWESGWDEGEKRSASDHVLRMLRDYNTESELFDKYDHFCIDILQSLIVLPLQEQNYSTINKSYKAFLKEFVKIEKEVGNPFYCLYILKGIIDSAREVRTDYIDKHARKKALKHFTHTVYECIDSVTKYCNVKEIHFEKMLCGVLCLAKNIEGVLYDAMFTRIKKKEKQYYKLPFQTLEQIYAILEINIPDNYEFNENTTVLVMDCANETCEERTLSKTQIEEINEIDPLCRGIELYKKLKN